MRRDGYAGGREGGLGSCVHTIKERERERERPGAIKTNKNNK